MADGLDAESDVFLLEGVLYCLCGNPIEADDAQGLVQREQGKEYVACPTCDMKYFAETGQFQFDE